MQSSDPPEPAAESTLPLPSRAPKRSLRGGRQGSSEAYNRKTVIMPDNGLKTIRSRPPGKGRGSRPAMAGLSPPSGAGSTPPMNARRQLSGALPSPTSVVVPSNTSVDSGLSPPTKVTLAAPTATLSANRPARPARPSPDQRRISAQMSSRATKSHGDMLVAARKQMEEMQLPKPSQRKVSLADGDMARKSGKKFSAFKRNKTLDANQFVPVDPAEKKKRKESQSRQSESSLSKSSSQLPSNDTVHRQSTPVSMQGTIRRKDSLPKPRGMPPMPSRQSSMASRRSSGAILRPPINKPKSVTLLEPPSAAPGPTRAPKRLPSTYRLSQRLTLQAIAVDNMLGDRHSVQELRSKGIIQEAGAEQAANTAAPTWTSKVVIAEEWIRPETLPPNVVPLIVRECMGSGFHIENGRKPVGTDPDVKELEGDREILDSHLDVHFFAQLSESADRIVHFAGLHDSLGPVIASVEKNKEKKFARALVRYNKGVERFLISTSGSSKAQVKALCNQLPFLAKYKLTEVKGDDADLYTENLLQYEDKEIVHEYKIGVIYAKEGQTTDDEFFNNTETPILFEEFLTFLGEKVELAGFTGYRGGLDVKTGTTGSHSIYRKFRGFEIMFHVSTMLPYFPQDLQQVERKRHLGNDVVVVVFKEGDTPFDPDSVHSQFNHIFIVIQPYKVVDGSCTHYRVEMCCKPGVKPFRPNLIFPGIYAKSMQFLELLLLKILNGERAAMQAPDFRTRMSRTRKMLLQEVIKGTKLRTSKR